MVTKAKAKTGLSAAVSSGLNKKKIERRQQRSLGNRVIMKDGTTVAVQFLTGIDGFKEYEIHRFQEDGSWVMVPCLGEGCPLCDDESDTKSKTSYRFVANVYNFKEKKVQVLEGPQDLASKIIFKLENMSNPALFTRRSWEVTRYPTNPTTYGMDKGEEDRISTKGLTPIDLDGYIDGQVKNYYGDELPTASSLDADDDDVDDVEDDDADEWTEKELRKKNSTALKKIAKDEGAAKKDIEACGNDKDELIALILGEDDDADEDEDDEDEDDDDLDEDEDDEDDDEDEDEDDEDEEDDDEEDEDDEPAPRRSSKKSAAKKPAKKAASRRR